LQTIFAPIGYPHIIPNIKAKEPSPLILKSGFINGLNNLPKKYGICVLDSNSVATKNGNKEGTTEVLHKINPDFAAAILEKEKIIKHNEKRKRIIGINIFFILNFNRNIFLPSIFTN
jgi:hypothetical protein